MSYTIEGKDIFIIGKLPPELKFDRAQMERDIQALMERYGLYRLTCSTDPEKSDSPKSAR